MKEKAAPIIATALLLGIFFNWFFVGKQASLAIPLYCALILLLTHAMAWSFKARINRAIYFIAPSIMFFSSMAFIRANEFIAFISTCTALYLLALGLHLMHVPGKSLRTFEFHGYIFLPKKLVKGVADSFSKLFRSLSSGRKTQASTSAYIPVIRGALIAAPIILIFLLLLSSADLVFNKYVTSVFHPHISLEFIFRTGLIAFIASLFIGAFAYIFMPHTSDEEVSQPAKHMLGSVETSIILGSVGTLFLIFVLIQSAYLFGGQSQIAATGYTYSEYARKGFFELIAVAAIALLLMGTLRKITFFKHEMQANMFKILSTILVAEVLVIMYSAHTRLNLYENTFGFTTLRLLSHLSLLWLVYAFGQFAYSVWKGKTDSYYAFQLFVSGLCFVALLGLINPDAVIARRNIARFNKTGKIDMQYLSTLSEDAMPQLASLLQHPNKQLQKDTARILYGKSYIYDQKQSWQELNIARERARNIYKNNKVQILAAKPYDTNVKVED